MSWTNKTRNLATFDDEEILTPDLHTILVGADEDQILLYQLAGDLWDNRAKNTSSYTNKSLSATSWTNKTKA